jgi:hypothetical protein
MNTTQVYLEETKNQKIAFKFIRRRTSWFSTCKHEFEIAALLLIDKLRNNLGITSASPGHMSFTGSPGTGKTTVGLKWLIFYIN